MTRECRRGSTLGRPGVTLASHQAVLPALLDRRFRQPLWLSSQAEDLRPDLHRRERIPFGRLVCDAWLGRYDIHRSWFGSTEVSVD